LVAPSRQSGGTRKSHRRYFLGKADILESTDSLILGVRTEILGAYALKYIAMANQFL